jgi:hypothetical protein
MQVDHRDADTLNNRKFNLRIVTKSQNNMNRNKQQNNKSGYKGILWYYHHGYNKWKASIRKDHKIYNLGYYDDINDAIKARKDAEIKFFGEYARKEKLQ